MIMIINIMNKDYAKTVIVILAMPSDFFFDYKAG